MSNEELDNSANSDDDRTFSMGDFLFLELGLPELFGTGVVRSYVIDAILTSLLRGGLLTKEELSSALTNGETAAEALVAKMAEVETQSAQAPKMAENLRKAAYKYSERIRADFIDSPTEESPESG